MSTSDITIISVDEVLDNLRKIFALLNSSKYSEINESNKIEQYKLRERFQRVNERLNGNRDSNVAFNSAISLEKLENKWSTFDSTFDGSVTVDRKGDYGDLIKYTMRFLEYLMSTRLFRNANKSNSVSLNYVDEKSERSRLNKINNKRNVLRSELDKAKKADVKDEAKIAQMQKQLDKLDQEFIEARKRVEQATVDTETKDTQSSDIDKAFEELGKYTEAIEQEQKRLNKEYKYSLISILVIAIIIFSFYAAFFILVSTKTLVLDRTIDFIPYGIGFGLFIGLLAVALYLKGRANKISIELSTRLFNIHYLEGLMKMTIKLSPNAQESSVRINNIIGALEKSYVHQVDGNFVSEQQLTKWERKEMKNNPYLRLLTQIKDITIKLLREKGNE